MSATLPVTPPPVVWQGEAPRAAAVEARRHAAAEREAARLERVQGLAEAHAALGAELGRDLGALAQRGRAVQALDRPAQGGLLAALVRALGGRREQLARRSATAALVGQYEAVQEALRRATTLADELEAAAVELQQEVDALHRERLAALADGRACAERVLALERALDAVPADHPEAARARDRLGFELRAESGRLRLVEAAAALVGEQLEPARRLRDTVQGLHEETARFVLQAAGTVNEAGRTIHALGVAADAPLVVAELQQALDRLDAAMLDTEAVVGQARHLLADVLPELNARLSARAEGQRAALVADLDGVDRAASHALAERALRAAAEAEVDALLGER